MRSGKPTGTDVFAEKSTRRAPEVVARERAQAEEVSKQVDAERQRQNREFARLERAEEARVERERVKFTELESDKRIGGPPAVESADEEGAEEEAVDHSRLLDASSGKRRARKVLWVTVIIYVF